MAGESMGALLKELITIRARQSADKKRRAELEQRLPELLQEQGVTSFKLDDGPKIYLKPDDIKVSAWPATKDDDEYHACLRSIGAGHLIKETPTVSNTALRAHVKTLIREGKAIPEAIGYSTSPSFAVSAGGWSPDNV
jgi:hypothetical protein